MAHVCSCTQHADHVIDLAFMLLPHDGGASQEPRSCPLGRRMASSKSEISLTKRVRTAMSCSWVRHLFNTGNQKLGGEGIGDGPAISSPGEGAFVEHLESVSHSSSESVSSKPGKSHFGTPRACAASVSKAAPAASIGAPSTKPMVFFFKILCRTVVSALSLATPCCSDEKNGWPQPSSSSSIQISRRMAVRSRACTKGKTSLRNAWNNRSSTDSTRALRASTLSAGLEGI
mmetsp:Transcript_131672/g.328329  ORF Transcript_131672/g.328329 Transcript_131672/m.328329 type:complete len:231 (+) Transcript_131672:282-974(+)|eukprot:CAMPEP_0115439854 /NCGR_PEP_ID=MMETSP0271-20121206/35990_1 /TAXON_ID=71861 /ORGANISM="Scrippsiella trochoidea, Strain CCMP3099" /LENGTH=230 /DNA_ID=CAMNT_0002865557 /DNA_START=769 /DNA_END=1461 /DNA_ORIENTATION=+